MKTVTLLIAAFILSSCDIDAQSQSVNRLPESITGKYRHHQGENNTGTVSIYPEHIRIDTERLNMDIDIAHLPAHSLSVNPDCWIFIYLSTCKLKISITGDQISIWIMDKNQTELYYGDPGYFGTFDKIRIPATTNN